jgi:hypothetical protein
MDVKPGFVVLVCENAKCPKPNREFQMAEKLAARTAGTRTFCSAACYAAYEKRWET